MLSYHMPNPELLATTGYCDGFGTLTKYIQLTGIVKYRQNSLNAEFDMKSSSRNWNSNEIEITNFGMPIFGFRT